MTAPIAPLAPLAPTLATAATGQTAGSPTDRAAAQKSFLTACMGFESDEITLINSTKLRDCTDDLVAAVRPEGGGLDPNRPFDTVNLTDVTPLGFAASLLSDMALRPHLFTNRAEDAIPSQDEAQCQLAARAALRQTVTAALAHGGPLRTTADPWGDEFQSLSALCAVDDTELIDRCVGAGLALDPTFVARMDLDGVDKLARAGGAFSTALSQALSDPIQNAAMSLALNRPDALSKLTDSALQALGPDVRQSLTQVTIDAALHHCVMGSAAAGTVKGLMAIGAQPLGLAAVAPAEPTLLWHALKDRYGIDAAKLLAEATPNLNESHDGRSLMGRASDRGSDEMVAMLAFKGAQFAGPEEALIALIDAAERGNVATMTMALDQGAPIDGIDRQGAPRTALISAALHDQPAAVGLLLDCGVNWQLKVRKAKMTRDEGYIEVETDFLEEAARIDAVSVLRVAGEKLGAPVLMALASPQHAPDAKEFLAAVRALGAIPPRPEPDSDADADADPFAGGGPGGVPDIKGLADLIKTVQAQGGQVVGVPPGGMDLTIGTAPRQATGKHWGP